MVTSICPAREDLRAFHLGMLDEHRELEVLDHLNDCQSCEDTVANLEGTADSLVAAVRSSANSQAATSEPSDREDRPALQQALSEIEAFVDSPVPSGKHIEDAASPVSERIRDYELLGTLGEGGMGTVYRARHTRLDRQVALKLLPARRLRDNAAVIRFEREMKAIGRLDHPAIVRATDAGDVDGTHFLAMDYVEGIDLSKLVRLVGPLDVASACEIVRQAALGLDYAHQQELIHRDVKPSNLMLTLQGDVRVLDLGLALFGAASEALDELTTVGQLMGTLDYMAPEQGDNSHDVDARADVYSLGATLFKLLTSTAPYDSPGTRTPLAKMKALATIDAPSVAERRSELPTELIAVVDRALLRNVEDRFASAKELADSLLPFCEGHVLSDLAECGRDLAMSEEEKIPQPPILPPFVQKADIPASPANVTRADGLGARPPGVGRRIATWMLVPLILLAGIVIWIQTDNGMLVVESAEGSIPIEIRSGGKFHSSETLSVGKNKLTIRSGTYEIVLPKEYDSLKVENNVFTLERGGEWVARISKKDQVALPGTAGGNFTDITQPPFLGSLPTLPGTNSRQTTGAPPGIEIPGTPGIPSGQRGATTPGTPRMATSNGTLVFSGKTFDEWQQAVLTGRCPGGTGKGGAGVVRARAEEPRRGSSRNRPGRD
jgi:serine/threonine protein kinase